MALVNQQPFIRRGSLRSRFRVLAFTSRVRLGEQINH
jgi:hypothetical protein